MPKGHAWLSLFLFLLLGAAAKKKDAAPLRYPRSPPPPASPPPSPTPKVDKTAEAGIHPLVAFGPHPVSNDAEFGLLIDAGSTGSRLHVYEWPKRVFSTLPPPISHPLTSELWTKRRAPGISSLADDPKAAAETLLPLIEHAKVLLRHYKADWHRFPIWVKATAGMRALPHTPRRAIIEEVRALLLSERNPFFFVEADSARVISGEEEAGYAWTGINFALGTPRASRGAARALAASVAGAPFLSRLAGTGASPPPVFAEKAPPFELRARRFLVPPCRSPAPQATCSRTARARAPRAPRAPWA